MKLCVLSFFVLAVKYSHSAGKAFRECLKETSEDSTGFGRPFTPQRINAACRQRFGKIRIENGSAGIIYEAENSAEFQKSPFIFSCCILKLQREFDKCLKKRTSNEGYSPDSFGPENCNDTNFVGGIGHYSTPYGDSFYPKNESIEPFPVKTFLCCDADIMRRLGIKNSTANSAPQKFRIKK